MQSRSILSRSLPLALACSFIFSFFAVLQVPSARAQSRVNDHDMEALMRNLRDDAKSFRPKFDSAIRKSTIRKTSQEKEARRQASTFEKQTDALLNRFKKDRHGQAEFASVLTSAEQMDAVVGSLALGPKVTGQWEKIRMELHQISDAYGMPERFGPKDQGMNRMGTNDAVSCSESAGAGKATRLVNECLQVSPATHPPCNVQNSCALIISEIKRSCALLGQTAPGFC
ncbi:MAG: hypothetical protein ABI164_10850, partial [Acidobacteriaceae bacterium]